MRLRWIEVRDFRNHHDTALEVPPGLIAVVGANAEGKTNLLEAMYYLCGLESPRVHADLPLVRVGAEAAFLRGEIETSAGRILVEAEIRATGQNRVQVNRSPVRRKRDLRKQVRAVFSGPDDLDIVGGEPGERRRFMDEALRALWPLKEGAEPAYEKALRQRNRLLKEWDGPGEPPELGAWDQELVHAGTALTLLRGEAVDAVAPRAGREFAALSGEPLLIEYESSVDRGTLPGSFHRRLLERRGDELIRRTTLVGPHRDDLRLLVQGLVARGFASHGESWGAALCLRLGLADAVGEIVGEQPVRYFDDPFSGFDPDRRDRIGQRLAGLDPLVIAVPDDQHVPSGAAVWRVKEGRVVAE